MTRTELLKKVRCAHDMLERAKYGCELPGSGDLAESGPVNQAFAIGWAKECMRLVLESADAS